MLTYVLAADGSPLMPTYNISKVRRMLKDGRAVIAGHKPGFTIRLTYALPDQKTPHTQKVELCEDTGYQHIGVSVKSKKHEYVHMQVDTLTDEKDHHDAQRRYRRNRRGRLRYRASRFDNRTHSKKPGWLAPSLQHKADIHVRLVSTFQKVLPIRDVYLEVGSFDTQILEAKEKGLPIPEGSDYQHGARYGIATLREAVFYRDGYQCQCCGKGIKVFQRNADGTEQDIAYVGQKYDAMVEYEDGKYHILTADQYGDFDEPQEDVEIPDIENEEGENNEQVQRNHLRKDV